MRIQPRNSRIRRGSEGLTLIEVLIAMFVFSIGGLGMAAASAAIVRQMSHSSLRIRSAFTARARDEKFHATSCRMLSGGSETQMGLRSTWTMSAGTVATLDQEIERAAMNENHIDRYLSAMPCE